MNRLVLFFCVAAAAAALSGCALEAATSGRVAIDDGRGHYADIRFTEHDRRLIEDYYANRPRYKKTPPGLAKRGGELPPGLARRERLPPGLRGRGLPERLETRLTPLPWPYARVVIGADVAIINRDTRVVVDVLHDVIE